MAPVGAGTGEERVAVPPKGDSSRSGDRGDPRPLTRIETELAGLRNRARVIRSEDSEEAKTPVFAHSGESASASR
jgi:hypothetical protein